MTRLALCPGAFLGRAAPPHLYQKRKDFRLVRGFSVSHHRPAGQAKVRNSSVCTSKVREPIYLPLFTPIGQCRNVLRRSSLFSAA